MSEEKKAHGLTVIQFHPKQPDKARALSTLDDLRARIESGLLQPKPGPAADHATGASALLPAREVVMRSDTAMIFSAIFALTLVAAMLAQVGMVVYGVVTR